MTSFRTANDKESFGTYISNGKCLILSGGIKVTVTKSPGVFGTTVEFVYKGVKFWAPREALTNYSAE